MSPELTFDNKKFLSSRRAGEIAGYTNDYVARLCRQGKVVGRMVGRAWYVEEGSFQNFLNANSAVKEKRNATLSRERKREYQATVTSPLFKERRRGIEHDLDETTTVRERERSEQPHFVPWLTSFRFPIFKTVSVLAIVTLVVVSAGMATNDRFASFVGGTFLDEWTTRIDDTRSEKTASVLGSIGSWISATWDTAYKGLLSFMTATFRTLSRSDDKPPDDEPMTAPPPLPKERDGVVVVPSSDIGADGERKKKEIQDAFSDEISIVPDADGRAGIIKPIFKTAEAEDYLYVLVPVDETDTDETSPRL